MCPKDFSTKFNLEVHKKIHSGEKQFQCTMCEKQFIQKSQLKSHMLVHLRVGGDLP